MRRLVNKTAWLSISLLLCVKSYGLEAVRFEPIPKSRVSVISLDSVLNPYHVKPHINDKQAFVLNSETMVSLSIVPVDFVAPDGATPRFQCGFYLVPSQGSQHYVSAIGGNEVDDCEQLQAIGRAADPGPRPRLIFIYEVLSPHDDRGTYPYIFKWDTERETYLLNEEQSEWVARQKPYLYTIGRLRQLLEQHFPAQPLGENHGKSIQ